VLAHFVRGWRWQFLLRPIKERTSLWIAFKAVMAGYAMNNVIPRAGELIRPAMASVEENMPFAGTLATIIVERIFDVIALGLLLFFLSLVSKKNSGLHSQISPALQFLFWLLFQPDLLSLSQFL